MSSSLRELVRRVAAEPLTHFLLLGVGLFALHRTVAPDPAPGSSTVVVSEEAEALLVAQFEQRQGREPTEEERADLVARHVDEEVLYREGIALGLDRSDPIVRRRVVQRMQLLLEDLAQPDPAQLRAFFESHADAYAGPATLALEHVYFGGEDARLRAEDARVALRGGADPGDLGQPFAHGNAFARRTRAQLERMFGPELAQAIVEAPLEEWVVARSGLGWHVVRVTSRAEGRVPELERVRARVVQDWRRARRGGATSSALASLRSRYRIDRGVAP